GNGKVEALALFDLGYLVESYKETGVISKGLNIASGIDGYALVVKALGLRGQDPEMEFAAAMVTLDHYRGGHHSHLQKAVAGASEGSLLARNLVSHFGDRGKNIAELRANVGLAKN